MEYHEVLASKKLLNAYVAYSYYEAIFYFSEIQCVHEMKAGGGSVFDDILYFFYLMVELQLLVLGFDSPFDDFYSFKKQFRAYLWRWLWP